jgi:hypothetical protein
MSSDMKPHQSKMSSFREKLQAAASRLKKRGDTSNIQRESQKDGNTALTLLPAMIQIQKSRTENEFTAKPSRNNVTTNGSKPDFSYTKLKPGQIRLVTIHPRQDDLMCSLTVVDMPKAGQPSMIPPYVGVSYVWGDNARPHGIKCNYSDTAIVQGKRHDFFTLDSIEYVKVASNLKRLLLRLRDYEEWGTFWVDSICINQEDVGERSEQVQLMSGIYSMAQNVLIWLGEEDDQTAKAFKCVQSLIDLRDLPFGEAPWHRLTVEQGRNENQTAPFILPLNLRGITALDKDEWDAFVGLFKRPWFHRIWVFQEVVMASDAVVLCGELSLPWDALHAGCKIVESSQIYRNNPRRWSCLPALNMATIRKSIINAKKGSNPDLWNAVMAELIFEKLLRQTRSAQATDPRDKVYALLSLAIGDEKIMPKPDYSSVSKINHVIN